MSWSPSKGPHGRAGDQSTATYVTFPIYRRTTYNGSTPRQSVDPDLSCFSLVADGTTVSVPDGHADAHNVHDSCCPPSPPPCSLIDRSAFGASRICATPPAAHPSASCKLKAASGDIRRHSLASCPMSRRTNVGSGRGQARLAAFSTVAVVPRVFAEAARRNGASR